MRALLGACVMLGACWRGGAAAPPEPVGNTSEVKPVRRDFSGAYWCTIADDGYEYERYPCVIKRVNGRAMLAKLAGSQRIRGFVTPEGDAGFRFEGELYCPWGECTQPLQGSFAKSAFGYHAKLAGGMEIRLERASADAFGGTGYGGDGYGDPFGYSGFRDDGGGDLGP